MSGADPSVAPSVAPSGDGSGDPSRARVLLLRWGPAVAWAAVIFLLSAQPGLRVSSDASVDGPFRNVAHLGAYGLLAVLVVHGLGALGRPLSARTALVAALLTIGYGVTDEIHQSMVPDRSGNLEDVVYDAIGTVGGLVAAELWGRMREGGRTVSRR